MKDTVRKFFKSLGMVAHIFNPSTLESEAVDVCAFEAILVYMVSFGTAGIVERLLYGL